MLENDEEQLANDPETPLTASLFEAKAVPEVKVIDRRFWAVRGEAGDLDGPLPELNLKPSYVQELEQKMALMEQKFQEKAGQFVEESRKIQERLSREMERRLEEEKHNILLEFATVLDDCARAREMLRQQEVAPEVLKGLTLIQEGLQRRLEKFGLSPLGAAGEDFNPVMHEAVEIREVGDATLDNKIVVVWQDGYRVQDRIIRPARVTVGRYSS